MQHACLANLSRVRLFIFAPSRLCVIRKKTPAKTRRRNEYKYQWFIFLSQIFPSNSDDTLMLAFHRIRIAQVETFYRLTLLELQAGLLRTLNCDKWTARVLLANQALPDL